MSVTKPVNYLGTHNTLWSNAEGILDTEIEERLRLGDCHALHAAWDYAGYVWFDPSNDTWYEEIWRYRAVVDTLSGDSATNVIAKAIASYGVR
jgi:hypothetical protein